MHKVVAPIIEMLYIEFIETGGFMSDIKVGDYIECIFSNDNNFMFTVGREYEVIGVDLNSKTYLFADNDGDHGDVYVPLNGHFWKFKKAEK